MNYKSVKDLRNVIISGLDLVPQDVDLVLGVPESGMLAATFLALSLNLPVMRSERIGRHCGIRHGRTREMKRNLTNIEQANHLLVVDDIVRTGRTLEAVKRRITESGFVGRVTYCAIYSEGEGSDHVDIVFERLTSYPQSYFEWNIQRSGILAECCIDIDGVICIDPQRSQNDGDGPAYHKFLETAQLLSSPNGELGYLVTSRLERYREHTEHWLRANNIRYKELHMLDLPDAETRRRLRAASKHKAKTYRAFPEALLFVESSVGESIEIARETGRPVLCFSDQKIYTHIDSVPEPQSRSLKGVKRLVRTTGKAIKILRNVKIDQLRRKPLQYRSLSDLNKTIIYNHHKLPRDIDLIVGIPRSGLLAGSLLSLHLGIPLIDIDEFIENRPLGRGQKSGPLPHDSRHVLVLDDTIYAGCSIAEAKRIICGSGVSANISYGAVFAHPKSVHLVDQYFELLESPGCQEWNMMHRGKAEDFCFEIEGILSKAPSAETRSDLPRYRDFCRTAGVLYRPSHPLGWIVTLRPECLRTETEEWLSRNNISYKGLFMWSNNREPNPTRSREAAFKACIYRKHSTSALFVDASEGIAADIARFSGKVSLAFDSQISFSPDQPVQILKRKLRKRLAKLDCQKARFGGREIAS
jgi:uncharacterized HAD superfamily protein/adenine/guanine phosphoribosyltransferase-like PRPP-binding protein